jgi:protein-S-isoprenylcysteine O-methyltransferase Ste14
MYWRLARHEEQETEAAFGDQYRRSARAVPAFFPRIAQTIPSAMR